MFNDSTLILFMFLIILLCILCIMLGYFYSRARIHIFFDKFMKEDMQRKMMPTKVIKIKPKNNEEFEEMMKKIFGEIENKNDENNENDKKGE